MHRIVNKSEQKEPFVVRESMLNDGHQCGACHNVSDAKVRMIKIEIKMWVCVFVYIVPSTDCVGALYLRPWGLAVGVVIMLSQVTSLVQ